MSFREILSEHIGRYPGLEPTDAVKLAFQAANGGGHLIPSPDYAMKRLREEYENIRHDGRLRVESLGKYSRVYIDCELSELQLGLIGRAFVESAKLLEDEDGTDSLEDCLAVITAAAKSGEFGFTADELEAYLADYRSRGCPAVSHSESYRALYRPAYRVIDSKYARILPLIFEVGEKLREKSRVILALEGRAASGKSTAAELISRIFGGEVLHMDDFFLPFDMRSPERMNEPGGNLHRERFLDEVVAYLPGGFAHRVFDCSSGGYLPEQRRFGGDGLLICEGCYCLHPEFGEYYDLAAFLTLAPDEQKRRILERNGEYMLGRFVNEWIPMEERYFEHFGIEERCDLVL